MIRRFVIGSIEVVVVAIALGAFFFVQVGRRTPYEHAAAIFSSPPTKEAMEDFSGAARKVRDGIVERAKNR